MHEEQEEIKQLDSSWTIILIIWGAILASLGIYLVVCIAIKDQVKINIDPNLPIETIKYVLYGVSVITLFVVHYLRKALLRGGNPTANTNQSNTPQDPAVGKYTVAVIITTALLESIGIYGVVLFFIAKDTMALYQLLIISAGAMIYFRPRKDELLTLSARMKAQETMGSGV